MKGDDTSKSKVVQAVGRNTVGHNPRISVDNSPGSSVWNLIIKNVQPQDAGRYMVQINTDPMKSQVHNNLDYISSRDIYYNNLEMLNTYHSDCIV